MAQKIKPSQMTNGIIYRRQGSSSTDWAAGGTTTYDVSSTAVKIQTGVVAVTSGNHSVTFPVAYTQNPVVVVGTFSAIAANVWTEVVAVSTTGMTLRCMDNGGTRTSEYASWIAIGV